MGYDSWISGIYTVYDGRFKYWEAEDNIVWLERIIKELDGHNRLYDEDGVYRFTPKDEYEGYKRSQTTEGELK